MIKRIRKKFKKVNSQKGFTLLEILVVLTIMGFLIAMVAPRLAGISGGAVDTVCDTNQNRMCGYMATFYETTHRYPNKLTNLVIVDGSATYQIPVASNQDPDDGAEVLANELYARNHFHIHYLNDDEAAELKDMGIVTVFNLNDYSGMSDTGTAAIAGVPNDVPVNNVPLTSRESSMHSKPLAGAVGVAMVGCGNSNAAGLTWAAASTERGWGEPANFARIVLGMGPECGLITSGVISNAAHCPGGIQNADNVTYNDYILLLPRLEATAARTTLTMLGGTDASELEAIAYDDAPDASGYDYSINANNYKVRTFDITAAQEGWQFATMCPEGHMYPADDEEFWGVDLDGSTLIN
jgi:prepilin-type N-terminal cleavage/methylation domain-containing protein